MSTIKKKILEGASKSSQRLSLGFKNVGKAVNPKKNLKKAKENQKRAQAERNEASDEEQLENYFEEADILLTPTNPSAADGEAQLYEDDEETLRTSTSDHELREKERKKNRLRKNAEMLMKLDATIALQVANKTTTRDAWEKCYSIRHNKRYWRHILTGITRWHRPYINDNLEADDDSTDISVYGSDSDSDSSNSSIEEMITSVIVIPLSLR